MTTQRRCAWLVAVLLANTVSTAMAAQDAGQVAERLLREAGFRRGICAVLGTEGDLAVELARASELLVHCRDPRREAVAAERALAARAGLSLQRLAVEEGSFRKLPYAENTIDLLVIPGMTEPGLGDVSPRELLRVLRPGGRAVIGNWFATENSLTESALRDWLPKTPAAQVIADNAETLTVSLVAPALAGAGEWSHWEHSPDNNPVSEDAVIKAPYMTQFMARPYYIAMPSVTTAAGGRTFLAIGHIAHHRREWDNMNKLIARNGYNGTILWERKLPEGYLVHRSAFIATADTFYMIDGDHVLLLDAATGADRGRITIPGVFGDLKWMVMHEGVLYVLAGNKDPGVQTTRGDRAFGGWSWADLSTGYYARPRVPWGFGTTLAAWSLQERKVLWTHEEKEKPIDARAMALRDDRVYFYCPEKHLRAADAHTGEILWTSDDRKVLDLIEEPGKGLTSTPGFRSACLAVATPEALIIQGQTRMNVVAISTRDGYHLWTKKKITNNPNAIFVDGRVILGVGKGGSHVALDPVSGQVLEDLGFRKRACTRLTACSDSFFVRGEGTLRYDRDTARVLIDGAARPACNDGALPANGLLYVGPWQCDCNLSLIGRVAKCSAGDFRFDHTATNEERLVAGDTKVPLADFSLTDKDWSTLRHDTDRSGSTPTEVALGGVAARWTHRPRFSHSPVPSVSGGGLVFAAGSDGCVRAIDGTSGRQVWEYQTPGEIRATPTLADGRLFVGAGDGRVYALEAATGRELWRFRAAPVERLINVYGSLTSTWPVHSGVLVKNGVAYCAAGIIDHDGTYVFALDAATGEIRWQNHSSGHLNEDLRKGVSVQGNLSIDGDRLLLAGGNQVSPAPFDLKTGECLAPTFAQGQPKANNGRFCGLFLGKYPIVGGRILFSAAENVSTKGSFTVMSGNRRVTLNYGGIPPAWSDSSVAIVNFLNGKLTCCDAKMVDQQVAAPPPTGANDRRGRVTLTNALAAAGAVQWQTDLGEPNKFQAVSLAICPNAVVAVIQQQQKARSQPQWYVAAFDKAKGRPLWRQEIRETPLPGGLLVDRDGQVVVTLLGGGLVSLGRPG